MFKLGQLSSVVLLASVLGLFAAPTAEATFGRGGHGHGGGKHGFFEKLFSHKGGGHKRGCDPKVDVPEVGAEGGAAALFLAMGGAAVLAGRRRRMGA